jgi:cysteinylglycine-S-conjugate dipeptidase
VWNDPPVTHDEIAAAVHQQLPQMLDELEALVGIASVSGPARPAEPIAETAALVARLFTEVGVDVDTLQIPATNAVVVGEIAAPPGAPTVLLYGHYDVVGAGDESEWKTAPFTPHRTAEAIFGRGAADSKSNIAAHLGALRAWAGHPPVGIRLLIEGEEEIGGGGLDGHLRTHPELAACDAMLIADGGSVRPGVPTLTTALRGLVNVIVEVRTLPTPQHSGLYGGAAPDALLVLLHALATLHDRNGDVAVDGLRREEWDGEDPDEAEFRELAQIPDELALIGTGGLGSRVWSGPAITVIGLDAPAVDTAVHAVVPYARAKLNVRLHPAQSAADGLAAITRHFDELRPFGVALTVTPDETGNGFAARTDSPAYDAARAAWSAAWGADVVSVAVGGGIPLVDTLHDAAPGADVLLVGAIDGYANIHGPNERVLIDELEKATVAEADFFARFAAL